jgi:uncharacterized protein (TIGR02118 family)
MTPAPSSARCKLISIHLGLDTIAQAETDREGRPAPLSLRQTISLPDLSPDACGWPAPDDYPRFAAVEENWFASFDDLRTHVAERMPREGPAVWHYHVEEHVRRDERPTIDLGERMPGVKEIFLLTRPAGHTRSEFVTHWLDIHHPLALRHHVGMWKYVQNVVLARLSEAGLPFDGVAELHYPTVADARDRRYGSEEGRAAIAADRPHFVGGSVALFTGEVCRRR